MSINKLPALAARQSLLAEGIKDLKKRGADAYFKCSDGFTSCLDKVIAEHKEVVEMNPGEFFHFSETYEELMAQDKVCEHCQECRNLKAERTNLSLQLGHVRGSITRIGKSIRKAEAEANE